MNYCQGEYTCVQTHKSWFLCLRMADRQSRTSLVTLHWDEEHREIAKHAACIMPVVQSTTALHLAYCSLAKQLNSCM